MAGQGLEKIKLQDGYKKLLVSGLDSGIQGAMTEISTSTGENITNTVMWAGQGDVDAAPLFKIKARQTNGQFFKITDSGGSAVNGDNEFDILVFHPDGTGGANLEGRGVWNGRMQVDVYGRGRIEFTNNSVQSLNVVPTIRKNSSNNNIEFEQPSGGSEYWSFDRIAILPGEEHSNPATFYAPGVPMQVGAITADSIAMSGSATFVHEGDSATWGLTNTIDFEAGDHIKIGGANDSYFEAADDIGDSSVWIEAFSSQSSGTSPTIRIGTIPTAMRDLNGDGSTTTAYGTQKVIIGDYLRSDGETLLNSKKITCNNSMLVQTLGNGGVWTDGFDNAFVGSSNASYYSIDDGTQGIPGWYDGKTNSNFYLEKLEVGHSRQPVYEGYENTSSISPAATITTLSDGAFQVYVKDGKLIFACNDNGTARYFSFDGRSTGDITDLTYGTSEPA